MAQIDDKQAIIEIVIKYADALKRDVEVSKIFIFGSYSRGQQHVDSDIDVAIVSPDFTDDIIENQVRLMKYRREIDLRIEPRPFKPAEFNSHNPLAREIMETGIELLPTVQETSADYTSEPF